MEVWMKERMRFYWWRITLPLGWNQEFLLFLRRLERFTFLQLLHLYIFENYILTHLEPVELEFVFASRFCPTRTENGRALFVVRPEEEECQQANKANRPKKNKISQSYFWTFTKKLQTEFENVISHRLTD